MTVPDWSDLEEQAKYWIRLRAQGYRPQIRDHPRVRVASGMYAIGHAKDRSEHAIWISEVRAEVVRILNAIGSWSQVQDARSRIADVFHQIALCGIEAHLEEELDHTLVRPWIPSPKACPGCFEALMAL